MTDLYTFLERKTSKKVADMVNAELNLYSASRVWVNLTTGTELSNYDYFKRIIKKVLDSCSKNALKDDDSVANKIIDSVKSKQDFKYININFYDYDDSLAIDVSSNINGSYKDYSKFGILAFSKSKQKYYRTSSVAYGFKPSIKKYYSADLVKTEKAIKDEIIGALINGVRN